MSNILTDAQSRAVTYDITGDIVAADRLVQRDLNRYCDCPYQNSTLAAVAEVQDVTAGDRTGGTMDLTIALADAQTMTVLALAWNAAASAVQTAVDAQAVIDITDYVAGDIAVTGGAFGAAGADTVFTFSGNSVHGNHPLIVVVGASLTGGTTDPVASQDIAGIVPRFWFAALKAMGVISGTDPAFGATPAGQYTVTIRDELENYSSGDTLKRLIAEATYQEGKDWNAELLPLLNLS